ncbi:MAG: ion channel [Desulfurococcales archaeon]|nr:ion channel [Desulfurococcales archaeon]
MELKRVFNANFRRMVDATVTASAVMVGLGLIGGSGGSLVLADLAVSLILVVVGAWTGLPRLVLALSSMPLYALDLAGTSIIAGHYIAVLIVLLRAARIAYDLLYLEAHSSIIGREILTLSVQAAVLAGVMLAGGSLALYVAESGSQASGIRSIWDALWVSIATTTTVGYGDVVPVTPMGRLVASMLMIFGVAYITFLITNIATLIVRIAATPTESGDVLEREKAMLAESLRTRLEEMSDEEFWEVVNRLNTIRILEAASRDTIEIDPGAGLIAPSRARRGEVAA